MSYAYDIWRTREDEWDGEEEARERWESEIDIVELLGHAEVEDLLWCAYGGADIRSRLDKLMDTKWKEEIQNRIECSYDF